jgi:hypothetical protein
MTRSYAAAAVLFVSTALLLTSPVMASAKPEYISGTVARTALTDGKSWAMTSTDGKKATFTFYSNGTGRFSGPIKKSIKWKMDGENFCIVMGMMLGTKCLRFTVIDGGYQGYAKDKPGMTFRR